MKEDIHALFFLTDGFSFRELEKGNQAQSVLNLSLFILHNYREESQMGSPLG